MNEFAEVEKRINELAREKLAPLKVVRIHMREGLTSFQEEPAYHIDIFFDGDGRPGGKRTNSLHTALFDHLWKIKDDHFPVVTYIKVGDEDKHHEPR